MCGLGLLASCLCCVVVDLCCADVVSGLRCESREGVCDDNPCGGDRGRCVPDGVTYQCVCTPPFTGNIVTNASEKTLI